MKDIINIIICDDDLAFQGILNDIIVDYFDSKNIKPNICFCESGEEFLGLFDEKRNIDLVFLDVNLDGMNGLSVADNIRKMDEEVYIVFVSSFGDYAVKGYQYNAFRFIVKNHMLKNYVEECLSVVIKEKNERKNEEIIIPNGLDIYTVKTRDIVYIESEGHIIKVYKKRKDKIVLYTTRVKLSELERKCSVDKNIIRVHKSFLLNLRYLENIENRRAKLSEDIEIPISKKYYDSVVMQYMNYKGRMV